MTLATKPFNTEEIKIKKLYESPELKKYDNIPVPSQKIRAVYEDDLKFPSYPEDRPYIFSSFVSSIDGKLAYADKPSAFYVAAKNMLAGGGKDTDFWILNALRGVCDGAVIGGNSLGTDDDYSMHVMDADIQADREKAGLTKVPLNIVMSLDATDIPLNHYILSNREVPSIISTSPRGYEFLKENLNREMILVGPYNSIADVEKNREDIIKKLKNLGNGTLPVIVTGADSYPNSQVIMKILKTIGINRLLIESPGYGNFLVKQKMMDEFFLNVSAVYIGGGDTMTLGKADKGFLADSHPHTKLLSIHIYNEYFTYYRYKFNYEFM